MISVQTNMSAWNTKRQFNVNRKKNVKTTEKLSSGYRINRAADDASGLSMSEKMRRQIRGLHQSADNIQEGTGYVQTAEGALNEVHDMLQRINELSVKAANGTCTAEERFYIDQEIQELKTEMNRIFSDTTFNEKKIWEPTNKVQIGTVQKQAVQFLGSYSKSLDVTNENCGVLAYSGYKINADTNGVSVSWMGWDGNDYQTEPIDWDTLKANNYSFEMSEYFGAPDPGNALYANGVPVFNNTISFQPQETAEIDDIIAGINNVTMISSSSASMNSSFENKDGSALNFNGISTFASINYSAAYASYRNAAAANQNNGHNFNDADDTFLEPADANGSLIQQTGSNLVSFPAATTDADARTSQETWAFSFYMNGIGKVTADTPHISYCAPSDKEADDEHYWWDWDYHYVNGNKEYYKRTNWISSNESGQGTLASVMNALTGEKGTSTPGLLTKKDNPAAGSSGDCRHGGYIDLAFNLKAETPYTFANNISSDNIGSYTIRISVDPGDTEQSVLDKITAALNKDTLLDFYTPSASYDRNYIYNASANSHVVDVPVYGGLCNFYVQAGTEAGQHIDINYDSLSVIELGLQNTNTLTQESSRTAIEDVKSALKVINKQRSDFGAYQNRLEHAYQVNKNSEENTQASESVIRDTDMAKTMVEYANNNLLLQAGTSILTQANQRANDVMYLLQ